MLNRSQHIEILEIAIAREVESIKLYLALAEYFVTKDISKIFIDTANEEMKHKNDLELEVMKFGSVIETENDFSDVSIEDSGILGELLLPEADYKNFLLLAISKEEAAFRFYVDLLSSIKDHQSREIIYELAQEEVRHKLKFEIEYQMQSKES